MMMMLTLSSRCQQPPISSDDYWLANAHA
jgi:hypothetical protein